MFLLALSYERPFTPHHSEITGHLLQTAHGHMVLHEATFTSHPTEIRIGQGQVDTLWPVCAHHYLVGGFEGTVLAAIVSLDALICHMLLHLDLGHGLLAVQREIGVHILAVVQVRVQVGIHLLQCPRPTTPPLLHTAVHLEAPKSLLVLDLLLSGEVFLSTCWTRLSLLLCLSNAGLTITLSTATGEGQLPGHQGTLLAIKVITNWIYKLTQIALGMIRDCHFETINCYGRHVRNSVAFLGGGGGGEVMCLEHICGHKEETTFSDVTQTPFTLVTPTPEDKFSVCKFIM